MSAIVPFDRQLKPADTNPVLVYLSRLHSPRSQRVMRDALRGILLLLTDAPPDDMPIEAVPFFQWEALRYQHVQAVRARLLVKYAPATVNRHLSALRGVLKECWRLGYLDAEAYRRITDVENVKYVVLPAGRDLPDREMRLLIQSCYDDGNKGIRDLAILALLFTTGIRRAELAALNVAHYNHDTGALRIFGKGRKERLVYVTNKTTDALEHWLTVRGADDGALFTSINKAGAVSRKRLPESTIHAMIARRAAAAGLDKLTPHDFRRTFVSNLLDSGVDAVTITALTGHASVDMLKRYDRRPERAKMDAARRLDLPV